jgi:hypothetical protein
MTTLLFKDIISIVSTSSGRYRYCNQHREQGKYEMRVGSIEGGGGMKSENGEAWGNGG